MDIEGENESKMLDRLHTSQFFSSYIIVYSIMCCFSILISNVSMSLLYIFIFLLYSYICYIVVSIDAGTTCKRKQTSRVRENDIVIKIIKINHIFIVLITINRHNHSALRNATTLHICRPTFKSGNHYPTI